MNIAITCVKGNQNKHTIEPRNIATVSQKNLFQFISYFFIH